MKREEYPLIPVHKLPSILRDSGVPQWFNRRIADAYDTAEYLKNTVGVPVEYINKLYNGLPTSIEDLRYNLYKNLNPSMGYNNPVKRVYEAATNTGADGMWNRDLMADDAYATYLQIPENKRKSKRLLQRAKYKPTKGDSTYDDVYALPLKNSEHDWGVLVEDASGLQIGESRAATKLPVTGYNVLGNYTLSRGYDGRGEYVSYYDDYDLNPYRGFFAEREGNKAPRFIQNKGDLSFGIGKPFSLYDRMYLDDYYGVKEPTHSTWLPEVTVKPRKK